MRSKYSLAALFFCLTTSITQAQEIIGDIRGIVRDPSGAVVSGASVQVINTDRDTVIRSMTTGADGAYVAPLLPLGHYRLVITASGFQQYNATDMVLNVNDRRVIDVSLVVGSNSQTVTVTEAAEPRFTRIPVSASASAGSSAPKHSTCSTIPI
ncbi:MAG: carboxypeptidase-like regulatory domain-containing protein [Acidobacteriia bacterium]|nr:carboxypeptidase-like regulatory domain-containing protein [Terriglobia bacterium]